MADRFDPQTLELLDSLVNGIPGVKRGQMFGHPAYYVGTKVFVSVMEDGIVVKLPAERIQPLLDGSTYRLFEPGGGPAMKQWLHIRRAAPRDHQQDEQLVHEALEYVAALPDKKRKA